MFQGRLKYACTAGVRFRHKIAIDESIPKITIPHQMVRKLEKKQILKERETYLKHRKIKYNTPAVIVCKRSAYNHHKGQTYSSFTPQKLASHGWKHSKSAGDYFILQGIQGHPAVLQGDDVPEFSELGVNPLLVAKLEEMKILKPTNIQAKAIIKFFEGSNIICAAETGSGKTLAYLLPVLQKAYEENKTKMERPTNSPSAIILVPCAELADQIQSVMNQLAPVLDLKPVVLCGQRGTAKLLEYRYRQRCDILVATPGVLYSVLSSRLYSSSNLQTLILDEADTLLDDSFADLTRQLYKNMQVYRSMVSSDMPGVGIQLGFVGATMPRDIEGSIGEFISTDSLVKVTTPFLHRLMPHVPQKFLRVKAAEKPEHLLKILKRDKKGRIPTIVFTNTNSTCDFLGHFLTDNNIEHIKLNGYMQNQGRRGLFQSFQDEKYNLLITTDITSRGLDTIRAQHIINYDFPNFMSDYIHRAGRVGRVGSKGTGYILSFVAGKWEVDLLWKIEAAARRVTELHNVNANIKRKLVGRHERKGMTDMDDEVD